MFLGNEKKKMGMLCSHNTTMNIYYRKAGRNLKGLRHKIELIDLTEIDYSRPNLRSSFYDASPIFHRKKIHICTGRPCIFLGR